MAEPASPQVDDSERRLRLALGLTAALWRSWTPESIAARLRRETPDFALQLCIALMTPEGVLAALRADQALAHEVLTTLASDALGAVYANGEVKVDPSAIPGTQEWTAAERQRAAAREPHDVGDVREPHAMFPSTKSFDIRWIQLIRYPRDGSSAEWCPKMWRAEDLRSWEQVRALYGGGEYRATALDLDRGVVARFPDDTQDYVVLKGARLSMTELGRPYVTAKKRAALEAGRAARKKPPAKAKTATKVPKGGKRASG